MAREPLSLSDACLTISSRLKIPRAVLRDMTGEDSHDGWLFRFRLMARRPKPSAEDGDMKASSDEQGDRAAKSCELGHLEIMTILAIPRFPTSLQLNSCSATLSE